MTEYTITVVNESLSAQEFYFFQEPAKYSGGNKVYVNSLGHAGLDAYNPAITNQIVFDYACQYYAGVQDQKKPPVVGQKQIGALSQVAIDLNEEGSDKGNKTNVIIGGTSLSLTIPSYDSGVQMGAFRMTTPTFDVVNKKINVGLSGKNQKGQIMLSNFIEGEPLKNTDVLPKMTFYVTVGEYTPGTVVDFTTSSVGAAACDTTRLGNDIMVKYQKDGTWKVSKAE